MALAQGSAVRNSNVFNVLNFFSIVLNINNLHERLSFKKDKVISN